jgi:hypothetical protein
VKNYLYTASIEKGTKKLISNTNSDWSKVMRGSFLRFTNDDLFYTVYGNEKIFIIKEFEVLDPRRIKVNDNLGISLGKRDLLKISYKEYEMSTVLDIIDGGNGYAENDIIELDGGFPSISINDNAPLKTKLCVKGVNENGKITEIGLVDRGRYNVFPQNPCKFVYNGAGSGATFELSENQIHQSSIIERNISIINNFNNHSIIFLDYALPDGIKKGKFTAEKWQAIIKEDYMGDTQVDFPYETYNDFTPNYNFPLPVRGSLSTEIILRQCLLTMDAKLKELENEISLLKQKNLSP